jgi:hypothetical protein
MLATKFILKFAKCCPSAANSVINFGVMEVAKIHSPSQVYSPLRLREYLHFISEYFHVGLG